MLILFINCHSFFLSVRGIIVYKGRGWLDVVNWGENAILVVSLTAELQAALQLVLLLLKFFYQYYWKHQNCLVLPVKYWKLHRNLLFTSLAND
ncbi:hypothetical protein AB3S75_005904 [Citrus x aurantiifolia]